MDVKGSNGVLYLDDTPVTRIKDFEAKVTGSTTESNFPSKLMGSWSGKLKFTMTPQSKKELRRLFRSMDGITLIRRLVRIGRYTKKGRITRKQFTRVFKILDKYVDRYNINLLLDRRGKDV